MLVAGIDVGATTAKAVILGDGGILGYSIKPTGRDVKLAANKVIQEALEKAGLSISIDGLNYVVSTGYARESIDFANKTVTEIICHAKGAHFMIPSTRFIIDMGGQDSKAIEVDPEGNVTNFIMNDKCAAGTGRFLEVMAQVLEVESVAEMGPLALQSKEPCHISSTCTVFAETEVVVLRAEGKDRKDLIAGIHKAVSARVAVMQHLLQASIYLIQFLLEPGDMSLDSLVYWWSGRIQPVFLSNQHAHHLIPASYQSGKSLSLRVRKGTWSGANRFSKTSQDLGIQSIGLGQLSGGFGKIPYLSGVDNYDRQTGGSQSSDHRKFQPARCFKEHQSRVKVSKLVDQALNTLLGVSNLPLLAGGADSDIQPCLGDVDSDESGFLIHYNLLEYFIALPCTIRAWLAMATVRAFFQRGAATLAFSRSLVTQKVSVYRALLLMVSIIHS